ncbi:MAG: biotin/lipoyl-binding protein [Clostridiales bacterium]|jgi:HlyD family secretion protein|nr:biotin/lipoyl-binding protein [Clostridiales bacterium]
MKALKRIVKIILFLIVAAGIGYAVYMSYTQPLAVNAIMLEPREARLTFTESGVVDYEDRVYVYPPVGGKVLEINVEPGQTVKAGDAICMIDMSDVDFAIDEANAQIQSLEAQIRNLDTERQRSNDSLAVQKNNLAMELQKLNAQENSANITVEQQRETQNQQIELQNKIIAQNLADIERMEVEFNNTTQILYDNGQLPRVEYDAAQEAIDKVKEQYEQNLQQLEIIKTGEATADPEYYNAARAAIQEQINGIDNSLSQDYTSAMKDYYSAQIAAANVSVERLRHSNENAVVTSGAEGVITDLPVSKSNVASGAAYLAEIAVGRSLVMVYVSTNDINTVKIDQEVDLILRRREGDETYQGKVVKIDDKAEVKVSSLGMEERKVKVYVEPASHRELFQQGYDVDVRFLVYKKDNALILPKTAVFKDGETDRVWEISDGVLKKTDVIKGMEFTNDVVIEGGLSAGSEVISDSTLKELVEGVKVTTGAQTAN